MRTSRLFLVVFSVTLAGCDRTLSADQMTELQGRLVKMEEAQAARIAELEQTVAAQRMAGAAVEKLRTDLDTLRASAETLAGVARNQNDQLRTLQSEATQSRREARTRELSLSTRTDELARDLNTAASRIDALARSLDALREEQLRRRGF